MKYLSLLLVVVLATHASHGQVDLMDTHLPIIKIETNGDWIIDEPKILVECGIINNPTGKNNIEDEFNEYDGFVGIEIRGQSSQFFDKKSYGIEFRDAVGEDLQVEVLGFPKEEDFVLHGPFSDKSLIRNAIAYTLARDVMEYAPRTKFVELVIDDSYKGVYLMTERIKRDKNRVDISKLEAIDFTEDEVEGGYILRFDKTDSDEEILWYSPYVVTPGNGGSPAFVAFYPKWEDLQDFQLDYIQGYVTDFEDALSSSDFSKDGKKYTEYLDIDSAIDYILICELLKNVDGYRISTYMYKDKGGKLKIGPVWDFNLAMGNADYCEGGNPEGWQFDFNYLCPWDAWVNHFWWKRFFEDDEFTERFKERYEELKENVFSKESIIERIDSLDSALGDAADRNFAQYDILGEYIWPNRFVGETHPQEIQYLKGWFDERIDFIDEKIANGFNTVTAKGEVVVYPNPTSGPFVVNMGELQLRSRFVHIYTSQGALIHEEVVTDEAEVTIDIDLNPGIYFIRIMDYKGVTLGPMKKLITT